MKILNGILFCAGGLMLIITIHSQPAKYTNGDIASLLIGLFGIYSGWPRNNEK